ncbi:nitrite/sulfite reductase [Oceanobacter kriegii]|uniref:nitrite/sulfite reductase n=1 Tax=Oceanobacter kriegii TaxID=64972 RepID=UPI00040A8AA7|nr:nitrite/sulfite reductase [Oceanobacter kriegii]
MYQYNDYDDALVLARVEEFRDQVARYQAGDLSDDEFLPLRLQNGLYMQRHAWMLRVAIPYGTLSADQLRLLGDIADRYDRGYGHFTTRQNLQFNWIELSDVPDILEALAGEHMHAIQTSGNCVRNITTEAFAGVASDEAMDPRPFAELLRQWATINPEFLFLPRKFKIAVSSSDEDRAVIRAHDIGLYLYLHNGEPHFRIMVGGGLGRTPILNQTLFEQVHWQDLLGCLEATLRVYNRFGRRDNKYKARIKILVKALGIDAFRDEVEQEWQKIRTSGAAPVVSHKELTRISAGFQREYPLYNQALDLEYGAWLARDKDFAQWVQQNTRAQKQPGFVAVVASTKPGPHTFENSAPGDLSSNQMRELADLAERYSDGEIRVTHEQNLVLTDVARCDLFPLWKAFQRIGLATPNIGLLTDIISCPGGDFCALANTKTLPVERQIQQQFDQLDYLHDLGELSLNVSGCMNACGHHHVGNIGILGVVKKGKDGIEEENFQVTIGGQQGKNARIGKIIGPAFPAEEIPTVLNRLTDHYISVREGDENFADCVERLGVPAFKDAVYNRGHQVLEESC